MNSPGLARNPLAACRAALLLCAGLLCGAPLAADDSQLLQVERTRFLEAKAALERGDTNSFHVLAAQLDAYPLAPYLRYWEASRRLAGLSRDVVHDLLRELAPTPLADLLRRRWIRLLADRQRWDDYVADYRGGYTTDECHYYHALHRLGRDAEAWQGAVRLWLVGRSQPSACDPLFAAWRAAGGQTPELAWQRVTLAMEQRQLGLARYLGRFLDAERAALVDLWLAVHGDPLNRLEDPRLQRDGPDERAIVQHGLYRLARRAPGAADTLWQRIGTRHAFTGAERAAIEREIALQHAYDGEARALELLSAVPREWHDEAVHEWAVRSALRFGQWPTALAWLERMPDAQRQEPRWSYWRARMLDETGASPAAAVLYRELGRGRGYYEFLAADRAGQAYTFGHVPVPESMTMAKALAATPAFVRARELYFAGLEVYARREWYAALDGQDERMQLLAGRLAAHWGWYDRAIFALGAAGYYDDLEIRFPLAYRTPLAAQARAQGLDPAWVFAVARQESAFAADARSPAGALGLMQIMPATGRKIARDLNSRLASQEHLLQPERNLHYGTFYLRQLLDQLGEHPVLANAAYNAGPHRVRRWLPEDGSQPADIWIETVPFRETRDYMQRVLAYTAIYQQRLGVPVTPLSQRMRAVTADLASRPAPGDGRG